MIAVKKGAFRLMGYREVLYRLGLDNKSRTYAVRDDSLPGRLKQAHKVMGRQGATIAALRGELARVRADNSKLDRGELRRLERFELMAKEQFALDKERLDRAHDEIGRLSEKLGELEDSAAE